jgi:hypothetical protein
MTYRIRTVDYYYLTVPDEQARGAGILTSLAERGVNLLAFAAVPLGPQRTQLTIFPEDGPQLADEAARGNQTLDGPHPALLVQGDDELGALAGIHGRLTDAGVEVFASSGVTDGRGGFGYVLYVRPEAMARAQAALGV